MTDPLRPSAADLTSALREAGVRLGETIYVAASLAALGLVPDPESTVMQALRQAVGPDGTIVMPAFNFSFCSGEAFDPDTTPAHTGALPEWFRKQPGVLRSWAPPFHSVVASGPGARALTELRSVSSFGPESVFTALAQMNARQILIGCGFHEGVAHVHWLEEQLEVPYRHWKKFEGQIRHDGREDRFGFFMYVRTDEVELNAEPLGEAFAATGAISQSTAGLCRIQTFSLARFAAFGRESLADNPFAVCSTPVPITPESPILGIDHIGVVSKYSDRITAFLGHAGLPLLFEGLVRDLDLNCRYFDTGNCFVELVDPETAESAVAGHASQRSDSPLHHIAFRVDDLETAIAHFRERGYAPLDGEIHLAPVPGERVCFLSPLFTGGLLVELVARGPDPRLIPDPRWTNA